MSETRVIDIRDALDGRAMACLLLLCAAWGMQQVAIKLALPTIPPFWQLAMRSAIPAVLLLVWARLQGENLLRPDRTWRAGLVLGVIFSIEFLLVYEGTARTTAARSVMFFYTAPFFVSLAAHLAIPGERLRRQQVAGLGLAFLGVLVAVGDGLRLPAWHEVAGDLMVLIGAVLWAVTTLMSRLTSLRYGSPARQVFYQMAMAALVTPIAAVWDGQAFPRAIDLTAAISILYQSVGVSFATYILWIWLIQRYPAARLSAFTFLTPVLGMGASALVLREPLTPLLLVALAFICAGIYLVNRRGPRALQASGEPLRERS